MSSVTFLRGIPASGKSTLAFAAVAGGAVRANLDDIRAMLGLPFSPEAEKLANKIHDKAILEAVKLGRDVVVDNTHVNDATPKRVITMLWESGLDVEYKLLDFEPDLETCLRRNFARDRVVPEDVIRKMHGQLEGRRRAGKLWTIEGILSGLPRIERYAPPQGKPTAVIVDIDGTLAHHHRSPYDYDQLETDTPHFDVKAVMLALSGDGSDRLIVCSGRPEDYRIPTERWLDDCFIPYDDLFMRNSGDDRRDSVIKLEIFNEYIRRRYNVLFCIDDRDRVVSLYRALGIRCWQVAEGDF